MTKKVHIELDLLLAKEMDETAIEILMHALLSNENYEEIAAILNIKIK